MSDDLLLTGSIVKESRGKDAYINNNFFKLVKNLKITDMVVDGEKAFALVNYDLASPKGKTMSCDVAEFWKIKNGKLDSIAIYFDTASFQKFMS